MRVQQFVSATDWGLALVFEILKLGVSVRKDERHCREIFENDH